MDSLPFSGRSFRTAFLLLLVAGISWLFVEVTLPFLQPLFFGAIFAGLARPLYLWMVKLLRGRESLASALTLVILFIVVVGPLSGVATVVVSQALEVSDRAIPLVRERFSGGEVFNVHDFLVQRFPSLADYVPSQEKLLETLANAAKATGGFLVGSASRITAATGIFLLNLFVMLYAMFFFLRDGPGILEKIFYYMPLRDEDEARMLQRFTSVTRATIKGTLVIGLIQGVLAGLGFWAAGLKGATFWGTIMVFLSIVPGIGATLVWLPAVIYLFVIKKTLAAILLGAWCATVVGTIDNVLRPLLVGKDAKMPDLLIMIGTLGGLVLFGPLGFIVGPIVCALFLTAWDIYGTVFQPILPPVKSLRAEKVGATAEEKE